MTSLNLGATLLIPSHIKPDENALNNGESVTKTVAGNISYKNVPTMEVWYSQPQISCTNQKFWSQHKRNMTEIIVTFQILGITLSGSQIWPPETKLDHTRKWVFKYLIRG